MSMTNCVCGSWTVKGSHFCHMCGNSLATNGHVFESSYGNGNGGHHHPGPLNEVQGVRGPGAKDKLTTTFLFAAAAAAGALFADWDSSWIAFSPMIYLAFDPAKEFILGLAGKIPMELSRDTTTTLKVEHYETNEAGRRFVGLYDLPAGIDLAHLQHIARICLPPPAGEGRSFSRPSLCKPGKLSQGQFNDLKANWLEINHCFYKNPLATSRGLILTERATRLLKKSLLLIAAD